MRPHLWIVGLALSIGISTVASAAGTSALHWSSSNYQSLLQRMGDAGREWGEAVLSLAETSLYARAHGIDYAYELKSLELFATKIKDLNDGLLTIEVLCASVTDPGLRRYALLVLDSYYVSIARSDINSAGQVFQAAATQSQYAIVREIGASLVVELGQYDKEVMTPRTAELDTLKVLLQADPERDGPGP